MKNLIIIIALLLCVVNNGDCDEFEFECSEETMQQLDDYVSKALGFGEPDVKYLSTPAELRRYCVRVREYIYFADNYINKCLDEYAKYTAKLLMYSIKNQIKIMCKPGKTSKRALELMKAAPCANAAKSGIAKCYNQLIDIMDGISYQAPDHLKIPLVCCNYHRFKECFISEAEEYKICTKALIDKVENWINEILGELINLMCYNYEPGSSKCEGIIGLTPESNKEARFKSPIIPAIDLFSNFKDSD